MTRDYGRTARTSFAGAVAARRRGESAAMRIPARLVSTILLLAVGVLAVRWLWAAHRTPAVVQPVSFNHKIHLDDGLTCDGCHQALGTPSPQAGKPPVSVCQTCHNPDSPLSDSATEKQLLSFLKQGKEPPWKRIHRVPDYVFFSHYRHATLGKIECKECHGEMEKRTTPPERPAYHMTMNWCMSCHRKRKAVADCDSCHI